MEDAPALVQERRSHSDDVEARAVTCRLRGREVEAPCALRLLMAEDAEQSRQACVAAMEDCLGRDTTQGGLVSSPAGRPSIPQPSQTRAPSSEAERAVSGLQGSGNDKSAVSERSECKVRHAVQPFPSTRRDPAQKLSGSGSLEQPSLPGLMKVGAHQRQSRPRRPPPQPREPADRLS